LKRARERKDKEDRRLQTNREHAVKGSAVIEGRWDPTQSRLTLSSQAALVNLQVLIWGYYRIME